MSKSKRKRLRELIAQGAVIMPGVPNASMARQVEQAGFDAVYLSGAGMINSTAGMPDIGLLNRDEVVRLAGYVAHAVGIPAVVDADTGFGEGEEVAKTVRELERAGLAGCHIEDQEFPKRCGHLAGKTIVDLQVMVARIKAAAAARGDKDFLIIARTDARGVEGLIAQWNGPGNIWPRVQIRFFQKRCRRPMSFVISPRRLKSRSWQT